MIAIHIADDKARMKMIAFDFVQKKLRALKAHNCLWRSFFEMLENQSSNYQHPKERMQLIKPGKGILQIKMEKEVKQKTHNYSF